MMKCPKCGFEQPKDQFCAKCGVNIESFKPRLNLGSGLTSILKPLLIAGVLIGLVFILFKGVEEQVTLTPEIELEENTQLGVGAKSLNNPSKQGRTAVVQQPQSNLAAPNPSPQDALKTTTTTQTTAPVKTFNQVNATLTVAEVNRLDFYNENDPEKTWHIFPDISPVNTFVTQDMVVKIGHNNFEFVDSLIRYDITLDLERITEKEVQAKINMRRVLTTSQQTQNYSVSINTSIPLGQNLVIVDSLPRNVVIERLDSILSTLYRSQLFLSRRSELVQIIKFENPTNSPQEQLTP